MAHVPRTGIGALHALTIHHRNAPLAQLERVALTPAMRAALYGHLRAHGIEATIVNGEVVVEKGEHTGTRSGRVIRNRLASSRHSSRPRATAALA